MIKLLDILHEKLGVSFSVVDQAEDIFDIINADTSKSEFDFKLRVGDELKDIKIKIVDPKKTDFAGYFNKNTTPPSVVLTDRTDISTLTHELKHADSFFRRKESFGKERIGNVYQSAVFKKINFISNKDYRVIYMLSYLLQQEEFEAYYNNTYVDFKNFLDKELPGKRSSKSVLTLWKQFISNQDPKVINTLYHLAAGTLKQGGFKIPIPSPEQQKPFKFENWVSKDSIDKLIWYCLKKYEGAQEGTLLKIIKLFTPEDLVDAYYEKVPPKYQNLVNSYKSKLEKDINNKMESYFKKFQRIPVLFID